MSYASSWSGGKDACFACYKAISAGYDVSCLVNFISDDFRRVRFHGTEANLIGLQAEAAGLELVQRETAGERYEEQFKETLAGLAGNGVEGMVFGDIFLQHCRDRTLSICDDIGIEAVFPLWQRDTEELVLEFVEAGFEAVVSGADGGVFDEDWIGKAVNGELLAYLKEKGADPCGENGEYHTIVTGGPLFKGRIEITKKKVIGRDGFWFLDTQEYSLVR